MQRRRWADWGTIIGVVRHRNVSSCDWDFDTSFCTVHEFSSMEDRYVKIDHASLRLIKISFCTVDLNKMKVTEGSHAEYDEGW